MSRLQVRLESMASRPTHMDLLADFETNFDKAVLSLHSNPLKSNLKSNQQSGGESTTSSFGRSLDATSMISGEENVSSLLVTELSQAKARVEHLENINAKILSRSNNLEKMYSKQSSDLESANLKMSNLQLELRMSKMETESATRSMREKAASLKEMQMEIDLVTKSAMDANVRAAEGMEVAKSIKSGQAQVEELEAKVAALQEWAVAAASAKEVILEQNKALVLKTAELEKENRILKGGNENEGATNDESRKDTGEIVERKLWSKSSSLVIGAGTVKGHIVKLGDHHLKDNESILLRWQFDVTPHDNDILFSILKGAIDDEKIKSADPVMRSRLVLGGGGGEVQSAFVVQNACTLVWSNEHSWVRPRTIKYSIQAFAVM